MMIRILPLLPFLSLAPAVWAGYVPPSPNHWKQTATTGQFPVRCVETHLAFDTSGFAYMFGSCAYGGAAGGTHNNDVFKFDIGTGAASKIYTCGTNPWPGGCQAGQVFDPSRNCVWFGPGYNAVCRTNGILWSPGLAYYGGLYRMNCADRAMSRIREDGLGGTYYLYDQRNDLLISVKDNNYHGARLSIYDIKRDTIYHRTSPFANVTSGWSVPVCFDTKRGLVVITRWGNSDTVVAARSVWFYNTTTQAWSSKTPSTVPPPMNVPLVYEPGMDKYVLFGTDRAGVAGTGDWHPQVWVYDYDGNTWTERPRGAAFYDTLNRPASTWPPLRTYPGCFGYSPKYKVLANWGGLPTNPPATAKEGSVAHPIWAFKLGEPGLSAIEARPTLSPVPALTVTPNPCMAGQSLRIERGQEINAEARVTLTDIRGRTVASVSGKDLTQWQSPKLAAGLYLVHLNISGRSVGTKKVAVIR